MGGLRTITGRLKNRRGAALVLIAIMMTVMVGMVGAGVDFARMYAFKAQLQVTADAAAMAGAHELVKIRPATVTSQAIAYSALNKVDGNNTATVTDPDVESVHWDFSTHVATVTSGWTDPLTNAVRVTARYNAPYTFAKIFGVQSSALSGQAMAALAYVGNTACLKPWAVYYRTLLQSLYPTNTPDPLTYDLTATDVQNLIANRTPVTMQFDNSSPTAPGNIANVKVSDPWNGNNSYTNAISGGCANLPIGPGTMLDADPNEGSGTTTNAVRNLCGVNGNGQNAFSCNKAVKLAVWDWNNGLSGAQLQYHVKFVGVFTITGYDPGQGNTTISRVSGYFTSMPDPDGGSFSGTPGPLTGKAVLVL